jgi:PhnB protein
LSDYTRDNVGFATAPNDHVVIPLDHQTTNSETNFKKITMIHVNPYLNFPGNSEEAFKFYQSIFGGELSINRFKDTPEAGRIPAADQEKMMHIALMVNNSPFLMATDTLESMGQKLEVGNNIHLSVFTSSEAETSRIFNAFAKKGKITVPLEKQFWGDFFGMVTDQFGIQWMVNYSTLHQSK